MTVITYQCNKCQRQINLVQQKTGIDHIGHCNITAGCRGVLYQIDVHQDYIRGQIPPSVEGLQNWEQRKVLYNYIQTVARDTWNIVHNLGTLPVVEVFVSVPTSQNPNNLQAIQPETITFPDANTAILTFPRVYSGQAQLIARASNPDLLHPRPVIPSVPVTNLQLTNNGELTLATKISSIGSLPNITVILQYTSATGTTTRGYTATNSPNSESPWSDVNTILVKGKGYIVRTMDIQSIETVNGTITNGTTIQLVGVNATGPFNIPIITISVPDNYFQVSGDYTLYFLPSSPFNVINTITNDATWYVLDSSYDVATNITTIIVTGTITTSGLGIIVHPGTRQIDPDEILILLGNVPFTTFDKVSNEYIDFTSVNNTATQFLIYFNGNEFFGSSSLITTIYPPIRQLS